MAWADGDALEYQPEGSKTSRPPLYGPQGPDNWICQSPLRRRMEWTSVFPLTPNLARSRGGGRWLTSLRDPVGRRARVESPDGLGKPAPSSDRVTGRTDTRSGSRGTIAWSRDARRSCPKGFLAETLPREGPRQTASSDDATPLADPDGARGLGSPSSDGIRLCGLFR